MGELAGTSHPSWFEASLPSCFSTAMSNGFYITGYRNTWPGSHWLLGWKKRLLPDRFSEDTESQPTKIPLMKKILRYSLFLPFLAAVSLGGLTGWAQKDSSIILQDTFDGQATGNTPGSPWVSHVDGASNGSMTVVADPTGRFNKTAGNQVLEWRKDGDGGPMALQAFNVFDSNTAPEILTVSFDFIETGSSEYDDFFSVDFYSGNGNGPANLAQRILVGRRKIGEANYLPGVIVRADIVVNNSTKPLIYQNGAGTLSPGHAQVWLNGKRVFSEFSKDHNRPGPVSGFQLNTSGSEQVVAWIDDFTIRNIPFAREETEEDASILFLSDFEFSLLGSEPGYWWTKVVAGAGRGSVLVHKDVENVMRSGSENQIVAFVGDGKSNSLHLRAISSMSLSRASDVGTFSFRLYEPDVEGGKDFVSLFSYIDTTDESRYIAHKIDFGGGAIAGFTYGYDTAVQIDYVINSSGKSIQYRDGTQTLSARFADVWVNGELVAAGIATNGGKPGRIRGFQLVGDRFATPHILMDDFILRNEPYVTEPFAQWQQEHFSPAELEDPMTSGSQGDPDGDGIANLLEYGLGSHPQTPSRDALPTVSVTKIEGQSYLELVFLWNAEADDVAYRVQVSSDLSTWNNNEDGTEIAYTEAVEGSPDGEGLKLVTVRDLTPFTNTARRFIRLQAVSTADAE